MHWIELRMNQAKYKPKSEKKAAEEKKVSTTKTTNQIYRWIIHKIV